LYLHATDSTFSYNFAKNMGRHMHSFFPTSTHILWKIGRGQLPPCSNSPWFIRPCDYYYIFSL